MNETLALVLIKCKHIFAVERALICPKANKMGIMQGSKNFSVNLRKFRDEAGLSQMDLANKAGVSNHTIFRAESKGVIPRGSNISKIAQALGIPEGFLYDDPSAEKPPRPNQNKTELMGVLYNVAPTLSVEELQDLVDIALGYAKK